MLHSEDQARGTKNKHNKQRCRGYKLNELHGNIMQSLVHKENQTQSQRSRATNVHTILQHYVLHSLMIQKKGECLKRLKLNKYGVWS